MLIYELAQYLTAQGMATFDPDGAGGNVFLEELPESPDDALCLYNTGGMARDVATSIRRPGAQIIVRGNGDVATVYAFALRVYDAFDGLKSVRLPGGTRVMLCQCRQSEPVSLGIDEVGRQQYSINLQFITGGE